MIGIVLEQLYKIKRHLSKNDHLRRLVLPSCMLDYQEAVRIKLTDSCWANLYSCLRVLHGFMERHLHLIS